MTASPVQRVDISNLSIDSELGRGGQGRVVAVNGFMIAGKWTAAAKIYAPEQLPDADPAALEKMIALPKDLGTTGGDWLMEHTAWPAVLVEDNGAVCGFLMRTIPDDYYFAFRTRTLGTQLKPSEVAFLLNSDSYTNDAGIAFDDRQRLLLLKDLAELLTRLHGMGVTVGDFSPKNMLFSLAPAPKSFLIDCDAAQLRGETVLRQVETPDWEAPAGEDRATTATDAYKFGLLAIRLFARDQTSRDTAPLSRVSADLGLLAVRSQQADPAGRPAPGAWTTALDAGIAAVAARAAQQAPTVTGRVTVPAPVVGSAPPRSGLLARLSPRSAALAIGGAVLALALIIGGVAHFEQQPAAAGNTSAVSNVSGSNGSAGNTGSAGSSGSAGNSGTANGAGSPAVATPSTSEPPSAVGVVTFGDQIIGDSRAIAVGQMFTTYFAGIDDQDYRRAISVFDPRGIINPSEPSALRVFAQGDATSNDTNVMLTDLEPGGGRVRTAEVTFQSQQAPGSGPSDSPDETCTLWDIEYQLTLPAPGSYKILKVISDTHTGC